MPITPGLPGSNRLSIFLTDTNGDIITVSDPIQGQTLPGPTSIVIKNFDGTTLFDTSMLNPQVNTLQCGVAVCTGSSSVVTFLQNYIGEQAPVVFITQIGTTPNGASASVHVNGTNGAWTGFTLELSSSFFGAYSWVSVGNPN